jgi:hypothetical protein
LKPSQAVERLGVATDDFFGNGRTELGVLQNAVESPELGRAVGVAVIRADHQVVFSGDSMMYGRSSLLSQPT